MSAGAGEAGGAVAEVSAPDVAARPGARSRPRSHPRLPLWAVALVVLTMTPVALGALSLVGDTWFPVGDWASLQYRTSRVGTADSPLVGPYTVKGWAHPGPMLYWLAAPLHRLTGGDSRALLWTAAIVNLATVAAIGAVAWRRGRAPLLVGVALLMAVLVHGITPDRLVDLWNPFLGLMPFLLTVLLVWDAALGRRRSLLVAVLPASLAIQSHVSFGALTAVVVLWLVAWCRWWPRLLPGVDARVSPEQSGLVDVRLPAPTFGPWRRVVRRGLWLGALLWALPLVDLVADTHNLASAVAHLAGRSGTQIGIGHGTGLVSRYLRPDGPWMGGDEPQRFMSVLGSGPVVAPLVLAVLVGCLLLARRRRLVDVAALASLVIVLVVASLPAAANLVAPAFSYLTQWLKVIGGLVWFTVGWTAWRLAEPWARAAPGRLRAVGLAGVVGVAAATVWSWGGAATLEPPVPFEGEVVQDLRAQVRDRLPTEGRYRLELAGDLVGHNGPGLFLYMIEDGYDVVTRDGAKGLKWGHEHRWSPGDPVDARLTVAVHYAYSWEDAYRDCLDDPAVRLVASYDGLTPAERVELDDLRWKGLERGRLTDADAERARVLGERAFRAGVFAGDQGCGADERSPRAGE